MLKDSQRQEILNNLVIHGELTVGEIVELSHLSTPAISHHLKLLSNAGLVTSRKEGTRKIYRAEFREAIEYLRDLLESLERETGIISGDNVEKQ